MQLGAFLKKEKLSFSTLFTIVSIGIREGSLDCAIILEFRVVYVVSALIMVGTEISIISYSICLEFAIGPKIALMLDITG